MTKSKMLQSKYIFEKAMRYCAYQERSVSDVKKKLYEWKVRPEMANKVIKTLLEENFLDEERFARVFTGGKFRIKKWGKRKIIAALRAREIPDNIIQKGLEEIDEDEYIKTLISLIEKKKASLSKPQSQVNRSKVLNYALSRGFEKHLIFDYL